MKSPYPDDRTLHNTLATLRAYSPKWLEMIASSPHERFQLAVRKSPSLDSRFECWDFVADYEMRSTITLTLPVLAKLMLIDRTELQDQIKYLEDTLRHGSAPIAVPTHVEPDDDSVSVDVPEKWTDTVMAVAEAALKKADAEEDWVTYDAMTSILVQCKKQLED